FMSTVDGASKMTHAMQMALRGPGFASINAIDHPDRYTPAYVHYIRNQMMPDPVAKQIVAGTDLDQVAQWMTGTSQGRAYMKALHVGDADVKVNEVASMVKKFRSEERRVGKEGRDGRERGSKEERVDGVRGEW